MERRTDEEAHPAERGATDRQDVGNGGIRAGVFRVLREVRLRPPARAEVAVQRYEVTRTSHQGVVALLRGSHRCGLLRRLARLPATVVTDPIANYTEFKGAMAENAVLQAIVPLMDDQTPCYWTSPGTAEVEFLVQRGEEVIPCGGEGRKQHQR